MLKASATYGILYHVVLELNNNFMPDEDDIVGDSPMPQVGLSLEQRILQSAYVAQHVPMLKSRPTIPIQKRFHRRTFTTHNAELFKPVFDAIINSNFTEERIIPYSVLDNSPSTVYIKVCDALKYLADEEIRTIPAPARQGLLRYEHLKNAYRVTKEFSAETGVPLGVGLRIRTRKVAKITSIAMPVNSAPGTMKMLTNKDTGASVTIITRLQADPTLIDPLTNKPSDKVPPITIEQFRDWKQLVIHFIEECPPNLLLSFSLNEILPEDETWLATYFSGFTGLAMHMDYMLDSEHSSIKVMKLGGD